MLNCIVYDFHNSGLKQMITDGSLIKATGRIIYYKKSGSLQMAVEKAALQGVGDLYARFERTKKKLYQEGVFSAAHKKALPAFSLHIGVVTSAAGAALHDIISVSTRRFDGIGITVYPVQVQGQDAARQICRGIAYFNENNDVDVIIVGRGGGSFEDLFAFNEECVARAVYASKIPVVSAVGHETDFSLCDMAADLRAPTPSAAAELVVKDKNALIDYLSEYKNKLLNQLLAVVTSYEKKTDMMSSAVRSYPFGMKIEQNNSKILSLNDMMKKGMQNILDKNKLYIEKAVSSLEDLNPKNVLKRGYAIVYDEQQRVVAKKDDASAQMDIEFVDGRVSVVRKG